MANLCRRRKDGKNVFVAEDCFRFLEEKGQHHYGPHFRIYPEDHALIFKLLVYFIRDQQTAHELGLNLRKGILLTGPIGCGKTSLMMLMRYLLSGPRQHVLKSTRTVSLEFQQDGYPVIQCYSTQFFHQRGGETYPKIYCFDDLGVEQPLKHYGNQCNIMAGAAPLKSCCPATICLSTTECSPISPPTYRPPRGGHRVAASEIEQAYGNRGASPLSLR